ncbi:MAG: hypothetical protein HY735_12135 [Verrucomicrobia bacterium]|nr:hypothetical protein [Verrucomicrobiota bacterium]
MNSMTTNRRNTSSLAAAALAAALMLGSGWAAEQPAGTPTRQKDIKRAHAFPEPILSVEQASEGESQRLEAILQATRAKVSQVQPNDRSKAATRASQEEIAALEDFVAAHPNSAWTPSLRANLGRHHRQQGRWTLALEHWQAAWEATQNHRDGHGKRVADYILAHWTRLLASLGRTDTLAAIFQKNRDRLLDQGPLSQMWVRTREAFGQMQRRPGLSYQCGTFALDAVSRQNSSAHDSVALLDVPSPASGFTMKQLAELSRQFQLGLVAVKRERGQDLIVPSVVHWRQNHYGAILRQHGELYEVVDPTFEDAQFLSAETINAEASGNFFISPTHIKPGWQELSPGEAEQTYGRGNPNFMADANDQICQTGCPPGCPAGAMSSPSHGEAPCDGCGERIQGMPGWSVSEPYLNLWLRDQPLGYQSALGPPVVLELSYKQRDEFATPGGLFNFGKSWQCSWLSYVETIGGTPPTTAVYVHLPGGGRSRFAFNNGEAINYYNNLRLRVLTSGSTVTGYELLWADGSKLVYDFFRTNPLGAWSQVFLSKQFDPQGRQTQFRYPNYDPNSEVVRLEEIVDADNRITRLYYETDFLYWHDLVTRVVDPFGRTARFFYLESGQLSEIQDVAGIRSLISYGTYGWPATLTTPYGLTSFEHTGEAIGEAENIDRSLVITAPGGGRHVYAYVQFCDNPDYAPYLPSAYPSGEVPQSTPIGTLDNQPNRRNSFYWGPRQSAGLPAALYSFTNAHYRKARTRHWLNGTDAYGLRKSVDTLSIQREPSPDAAGATEGQKTWYDYAGKLGGQPSLTGPQILPSVIARRLPDGSTWYEYYQRDSLGRPTSVTSTYGNGLTTRTYSFAYDSAGNLTQESGPSGLIATYSYDNSFHQVSTITRSVDASTSYVTSFSYNPTTRLLQSITHPNATITEFAYNGENRLILLKDRTVGAGTEIRRQSFTYYPSGLDNTLTDELGLVRTFTWDNLQRLTRIDYSTGGFETFSYSLASELQPGMGLNILDLTGFIDRLGYSTSFGYNGLRQRTSIKNARNYATNLGYCPCGALETINNALSQATTFLYDNAGRLTSQVFPGGTTRNYRYNLLGQRTELLDHAGNVVASYTYNNQGLLATLTNPSGQVATFSYDAEDRPVSITETGGPTVTLSYDRLGRVLSRGESGGGTQTFQYSADGLTRHTDALGKITQYSYDWNYRRVTVTNAKNEVTQLTYDAAGNLIGLIDGKNQSRSWSYNSEGRLISKSDSSGTVLTFSYDNDGRLTSRWSAANGSTYFSYDAVGNLTLINYPISPDVTYAYDALDRLVSMTDANTGATSFSYSSFGALLEENPPLNDDSIAYSYDSNRRRSRLSLTKPGGSVWAQDYTYDAAGRLGTITSPAGTFTYSYAGASRRVNNLALPTGSSVVNGYDGLGRLTSTELRASGGNAMNQHSYLYDNAHRRTRQTRMGNYVNYTYDDIGQLTASRGYESNGASRWHEQMNWGFDAAGNLNLRWNDALRQDLIVGSRNQLSSANSTGTLTVAGMTGGSVNTLTVNGALVPIYSDGAFAARGVGLAGLITATVNGPAGNTSYDYSGGNGTGTIYFGNDLNGNLAGDGLKSFYYDDENRLVKVQVSGLWRVEYTYDGLGRRRHRREYDYWGNLLQFTRYLYDGYSVIQERNYQDQIVATYTRGLDLSGSLEGAGGIGGLLARTETYGTSAYYHSDGNGNVTALINSSQQVMARYLYDPFGSLIGLIGPWADLNTYRFSSKEYDPKTGLYYYLRRFYDPNLQRWVTRDPLGEAGGINLYQFVGNDPVNNVDPWGLYETDFHYYTIYYLLRNTGYSARESHWIAGYSQYVDDNPLTSPITNWRNPELLSRFHFAGSSPHQGVERNDFGAQQLLSVALRNYKAGAPGSLPRLGAALHRYADTWAHEGFTPWRHSMNRVTGSWRPNIGHADAAEIGAAPDRPYNDVARALSSAKSIYDLVSYGRSGCADWRNIESDLRAVFAPRRSKEKDRIHALQELIQRRFGERPSYNKAQFAPFERHFINSLF